MRGRALFKWAFGTAVLGQYFVRRFFSDSTPFGFPVERRDGTTLPLMNRHLPGTAWVDMPAILAGNRPVVLDMMWDLAGLPAPSIPDATLYDPHSSVDGHASVIADPVNYGDRALTRISDPAFPLRGPMSIFPNGIVLLPGTAGQSYLDATDKVDFLIRHREALDAWAAQTLSERKPPGWSYASHYVILGNGSLIRCVQHEIAHRSDGSMMHVFHAQTTSDHVFDGAFVWAWHFDPEAPHQITTLGIQVGKHAWIAADGANPAGGLCLVRHNGRSAPDVLAARDVGPYRTGDRSVVKDPGLRFLGAVLEAGDHLLSPIGQWVRSNYGPPQTAAEEYVLADDSHIGRMVALGPESLDTMDLPTATEAGIFADNVRIVPQELPFGMPGAPAGYAQVRDDVASMFLYQMAQTTWEAIRTDVVDYAAQRLEEHWADRSSDELMDALLGDVSSSVHIKSIVRDRILEPILPQLRDVMIAKGVAANDRSFVEWHVTNRFHADVVSPLLASDGALRSALELRILDEQVKVIDRDAVDRAAAAAVNRLAAERHEIDRLREARAGAHPDELAEIDRELADREKEEAAAAIEAERYRDQLDALVHYDEYREAYRAHEQRESARLFPGPADR